MFLLPTIIKAAGELQELLPVHNRRDEDPNALLYRYRKNGNWASRSAVQNSLFWTEG